MLTDPILQHGDWNDIIPLLPENLRLLWITRVLNSDGLSVRKKQSADQIKQRERIRPDNHLFRRTGYSAKMFGIVGNLATQPFF
ncbi:hypothetical protein GNF98_20340, partial [Clostridium perfringens]